MRIYNLKVVISYQISLLARRCWDSPECWLFSVSKWCNCVADAIEDAVRGCCCCCWPIALAHTEAADADTAKLLSPSAWRVAAAAWELDVVTPVTVQPGRLDEGPLSLFWLRENWTYGFQNNCSVTACHYASLCLHRRNVATSSGYPQYQ